MFIPIRWIPAFRVPDPSGAATFEAPPMPSIEPLSPPPQDAAADSPSERGL
jgi:hypothetical protein